MTNSAVARQRAGGTGAKPGQAKRSLSRGQQDEGRWAVARWLTNPPPSFLGFLLNHQFHAWWN